MATKLLSIEDLMKKSAARRKVVEIAGWGAAEIQCLSVDERDDVDEKSKRGETDEAGKSLFDYKEFVYLLLRYGLVTPQMTHEQFEQFRDDENGFIPEIVKEIQYFSGILKRPEVPENGPLPEKSGSDTTSAAPSEG